jgi:hypothetical protein
VLTLLVLLLLLLDEVVQLSGVVDDIVCTVDVESLLCVGESMSS